MDNTLIIFIILNIFNVIIQTVKSIVTVKAGKTVAAIFNAVAYALYTFVVIYMVADINVWLKAGIIGGANLIGVYVVKLVEEKKRKDKLWKVETTVKKDININDLMSIFENAKIPHNYIDIDGYYLVNAYCSTQAQSTAVKEILSQYNAKYFVSESKTL